MKYAIVEKIDYRIIGEGRDSTKSFTRLIKRAEKLADEHGLRMTDICIYKGDFVDDHIIRREGDFPIWK